MIGNKYMACRQCGCTLEPYRIVDICTSCAKANLEKSLASHPELKKAVKEHFKKQRDYYAGKVAERGGD